MIENELVDGNELVTMLLLRGRLANEKSQTHLIETQQEIKKLSEQMNKNIYNRDIVVSCKNMSADDIQFIYGMLNNLCANDNRITYTSIESKCK